MIDVPTLVSELQDHLGNAPGISDDDALLLLNRSYWDIIDKYKFREKEVTAFFQTVAGQAPYNVPAPFEALRQLSIEDPYTYRHTTLNMIPPVEYEKELVNNPDGSSYAKPCKYTRENCFVRLLPVPDQVYNITMKYWTVLDDLQNANGEFPETPQSWSEIILLGAVYRGWFKLIDYDKMRSAQAIYVEALNTAVERESKEEGDTHEAGLNVLRRDSGYIGFGYARNDAFNRF